MKKLILLIFISLLFFYNCSKETTEKEEPEIKVESTDFAFMAYASRERGNVLVYKSKDGETWTKYETNLKKGHRFKDVLFVKNKLWGLIEEGCNAALPLLMTSLDGITWNEVKTNIPKNRKAPKRIYGLKYDKATGLFILSTDVEDCYSGGFMTSKNGKNWSSLNIFNQVGGRHDLCRLENGTYVSVGQDKGWGETMQDKVAVSKDLINWKLVKNKNASYFSRLMYHPKKKIIVAVRKTNVIANFGPFPQINYSEDGLNWKAATGTFEQKVQLPVANLHTPIKGCAFNNSIFVAISQHGSLTSTNGKNWQQHPNFTGKLTKTDLAYGNGVFIAGAHCSTIDNKYIIDKNFDILYSSTDGTNWKPVLNKMGEGIRDIFFIPVDATKANK